MVCVCNMEDNEHVYQNDNENIYAVFEVIAVALPAGYTLLRLGTPNDRYARTIKTNVESRGSRQSFTKTKRSTPSFGTRKQPFYVGAEFLCKGQIYILCRGRITFYVGAELHFM